ncbi:hypothetical protein F4776DRAFT_25454 [Hypoxylon sp. NC0597]|nr:hypothetical protein F4776DRAFT_25454 [Hypoxylon sp. NC0597]
MRSSKPRDTYPLRSKSWKPKASMNSLPEELLLRVVEQLDRKYDADTILSLRGVNRKWRRIATPYIYITASGFGETFIEQPRIESSTDFLSNLCWKLSHQPQLSGFIKEMVSEPWRDVRRGLQFCPQFLRSVYCNLLSEAARDVPRDLRRQIASEMPSNVADALFAFILIMCRQIETLVIEALDTGCGPRTREVIYFALKQQHMPLQGRARHVLGSIKSFRLGDYVNGFCLTDALCLLSLPTLEHLSLGNLGDNCIDEQPEPPCVIPKPCARNLTSLALDSCHLSGKGLTKLLAACPNLQTLNIRMRTRNVKPSRPPCFGGALEDHGKGLQFLYLDTTAFDDDRTPEQSAHFLEALDSLDGSLKWLVITRADFTTAEDLAAALPKSVYVLIILGFRGVDGNASPFQSLLYDPRLPNLRRIACLPGAPGDLGHSAYCTSLGRCLPTDADVRKCGGTTFER